MELLERRESAPLFGYNADFYIYALWVLIISCFYRFICEYQGYQRHQRSISFVAEQQLLFLVSFVAFVISPTFVLIFFTISFWKFK